MNDSNSEIEPNKSTKQLSNEIIILQQENQKLKEEMNVIKKHIVNLHFQLLNTDVDIAQDELVPAIPLHAPINASSGASVKIGFVSYCESD